MITMLTITLRVDPSKVGRAIVGPIIIYVIDFEHTLGLWTMKSDADKPVNEMLFSHTRTRKIDS